MRTAFSLVPRQSSSTQPVDDGLDHKDLGPQLNLVFWLLTTLATLFLTLRLYCKYHRGRRLWWDDYFLIASWVGYAADRASKLRYKANQCPGLIGYLGRHHHGVREPRLRQTWIRYGPRQPPKNALRRRICRFLLRSRRRLEQDIVRPNSAPAEPGLDDEGRHLVHNLDHERHNGYRHALHVDQVSAVRQGVGRNSGRLVHRPG